MAQNISVKLEVYLMANQKPKKTTKKSSTKSELKTTKKENSNLSMAKTTKSTTDEASLQGFFARKCDRNENVLTIFKSKRIWGALLGELIGTMLISMLLLTLGVQQPLYFVLAALCIYVTVVGLSGANLNPLITAGMMATRRMSAIRGILYILAQIMGAWIGLIIVNAFLQNSAGAETVDLPMMSEMTGEVFFSIALVELLGALVLGFFYARSLIFAKKSPLTFGFIMTSGLTLVFIFGIVIAQSFFAYVEPTFIFNPAVALMYQIIPTTADNIGELFGLVGLVLSAYVLIPVLGGIIGFWISDVATRLSAGGYFCDDSLCDSMEEVVEVDVEE